MFTHDDDRFQLQCYAYSEQMIYQTTGSKKGEAQSGRIETVKLCHDIFAKMRIAIFSLAVCVCVVFIIGWY